MAGRRREEEVYLKGLFKWMRHLKPDFTYDELGKYSTKIYLEGVELDNFRKLQAKGIRNSLKEDEDGWYTTLSRRGALKGKGGKILSQQPPLVFRMDGEQKIPITTLVGNGSVGIAKCALWHYNPTPQISGWALRWEAARIDNLVEYSELDNDYNFERDPDMRQIRDLDKQEPLF